MQGHSLIHIILLQPETSPHILLFALKQSQSNDMLGVRSTFTGLQLLPGTCEFFFFFFYYTAGHFGIRLRVKFETAGGWFDL